MKKTRKRAPERPVVASNSTALDSTNGKQAELIAAPEPKIDRIVFPVFHFVACVPSGIATPCGSMNYDGGRT